MADITTTTVKNQIKRKVSDSAIELIHPETQADVVINTSSIEGSTVDDVFDNAITPKASYISTDAWGAVAKASTDTIVVGSKTYYTRTTSSAGRGYLNDGTYAYTKVASPTGNPSTSGYYELTNLGQNASDVQTVLENGNIGSGGESSGVSTIKIGTMSTAKSGDVVVSLSDIGAQAAITGAATTITSSNLTANRALISNASGKVAVSDITSTELGYLDGVTSNVQTQLNEKVGTSDTLTANAIILGNGNKTVKVSSYQINSTSTFAGAANTLSTDDKVKTYIDTAITSGAEYLGACTAINTITGVITGFSKQPDTAGDWGRVSTAFTVPANISSTGSAETAHAGDIVICTTISTSNPLYKWDVLHTEVNTNTWRPVNADSGTKLSDSTTELIIAGGNNITTSISNGTVTINHDTKPSTGSAAGTSTGSGRTYVTEVDIDSYGHVSGVKTATETVINTTYTFTSGASDTTNSFTVTPSGGTAQTVKVNPSATITANATDGLWDLTGTSGTNAVTYALGAYSSQQSKASFDTSSTNPTRSERLNYNGYFYATKLYSGGSAVLTSNQNITINSGKKVDNITDITGTASGTTPTLGDSGVTAGTYCAVSVNAKGIVTAGAHVIKHYPSSTTDENIATDALLVSGGFAFVEIA